MVKKTFTDIRLEAAGKLCNQLLGFMKQRVRTIKVAQVTKGGNQGLVKR